MPTKPKVLIIWFFAGKKKKKCADLWVRPVGLYCLVKIYHVIILWLCSNLTSLKIRSRKSDIGRDTTKTRDVQLFYQVEIVLRTASD